MKLKKYPDLHFSNFEGTSPYLDELRKKLLSLADEKRKWEAELSRVMSDRYKRKSDGGCKVALGWDRSCLSNNDGEQSNARRMIDSIQNQINTINDSDIPKEVARLGVLVAPTITATQEATKLVNAEANKINAEAAANPEIAIAKAASEAKIAEESRLWETAKAQLANKKVLIGGGIGIVLLIALGVLFYFYKKAKVV